jgi:hypothetical protein
MILGYSLAAIQVIPMKIHVRNIQVVNNYPENQCGNFSHLKSVIFTTRNDHSMDAMKVILVQGINIIP